MAVTSTAEYQAGIDSIYDRESELKAFDESKAGVKGLLDAGVTKVPRMFHSGQFSLDERPERESQISIPIIDLEGIHKDSNVRAQVIEKVRNACEKFGFFQVVDHGIPVTLLDEMINGMQRFHEQDTEVKKEFYSRDYGKKVHYLSNHDLYQSTAADWRDTFVYRVPSNAPELEELPAVCRVIVKEYSEKVVKLGLDFFELLSEALGLNPSHLKDMDCAEAHLLLGHYYPSCPEPELALGTKDHTDSSFITILLQDQKGGLQVLLENQWVNVPPVHGALVVNVGDLLQVTMSHRGKRRARRGSSLKRQPMSLGSPSVHLDDSEQQDVAQLLGIQDGYRPVLPGDMEGEIPLHNPYGRAGMAQMGYLPESQLGQSMQGHVEHLGDSQLGQSMQGHVEHIDDSQHSAGPDDSDTSAEEDCIGATQDTADPQPTDPAPGDHLLPRQVRTISTDSEGNEVIEVFTIRDSHRLPGVPAGKRIIMEYNAACQPVGVSSMRFKRMAGDIVRSSNYVRIPDDWAKVPQRTKEDIWDALMAYFFVPPEFNLKAIKNEAFKDMGSKLRTWRYELKKRCAITEEDTPDTIRARVGEKTLDEYNAEDVEILLERWCTRQNKDYANKMKRLRALNKEPHCTGSKSYARVTNEEAIRLGKYTTRAESYISTHTKVDKSYPNEIVEERCKRMKELIPTDPAASSSITEGTVKWAPNDAYAQALGDKPEYAGRVRQLGSGILPVRGSIRSYYTPSQARSQNTSHSMISQETLDRALEAERAKHKEEIDALVAANNARQAAFDARLRQIEAMMRFSSAPAGASPHIAVVPSSIDGEAVMERML